jgi:hypothetical protein
MNAVRPPTGRGRTNRRGMLRRFVGEAVGLATQLGRLETAPDSPEQSAPSNTHLPSPHPAAAAATRTPTIAEIEAAAERAGLADRAEEVRRLLVPSFRLVRREGPTHDPADPTLGIAWEAKSAVGAPVVQVSLSEGRDLTCFRERPTCPRAPIAPYAIRVCGAGDVGEGHPLELSMEFVLPRAWSSAVQALGLSAAELDAWEALRGRLATLHGLTPPDALVGTATIHRVLGYPDETTGSMPLACAMLAAGIDLGDAPPFAHPEARRYEPEATDWRMLLQLSRDDTLGWSWGPRNERLYIWTRKGQLASENLEDGLALIQ